MTSSKYYGKIGFSINNETKPGIFEETTVEKNYYINIVKNNRRLDQNSSINGTISISNTFSIISDPFTEANIYNMKYVEYNGILWRITNVTIESPRLILNVGGRYE